MTKRGSAGNASWGCAFSAIVACHAGEVMSGELCVSKSASRTVKLSNRRCSSSVRQLASGRFNFQSSGCHLSLFWSLCYNTNQMRMVQKDDGCAILSSEGAFTLFSYGGRRIKFSAPYSLKRYVKVKKWDRGYIEVDTEYAHGIEEEYIDLEPILENLFIKPSKFLTPIKRVEVRYA